MTRVSVGIQDLAPVVFRLGREGEFFVWSISLDDSADGQRKKIFVVAGFLGDSEDWFEVERLWEKRIKSEGLSYFRATECYSLTGEFIKLVKQYGAPTARDKSGVLLDDLKLLIKSSNLQAFCLGVSIDDYKTVRDEPNGHLVLEQDPYIQAHKMLIYAVARVVRASESPSPVAFCYDEHSKAAMLQKDWAKFKENHPMAAECMATLMPLDDKTTPAVQAADLIAHSTKRYFENRIDKNIPIQRAGSAVELAELAEWARSLCRVWFWEKNQLREFVSACVEVYEKGFREPETDIFW